MSDDPTTDAEIISAYLDGEATPAEVARVRSDPSLLAEAADLEAVREQLSVDGPPAGLVDDQVVAALAAYDREAVTDGARPAVTELASRRPPLLQRLPLGAIAAAVVILALFGALTQIDTGDDDDTASEVATAADDGGDDSADDAGDSDGDSALNSENAADSAAPDEGSAGAGRSESFAVAFGDTDELARHLSVLVEESTTTEQSDDAQPSTTNTTAAEERTVDPCDAVAVSGIDRSTVELVFPAVVAGSPVTAVVTEPTGDGERRLVVVDDGSCTIVDDRSL